MRKISTDGLNIYQKCPKYFKLDNAKVPPKGMVASIILESYQRTANFQKKIDWRTVRSIATKQSLSAEGNVYSKTINVLNALREWYLKYYRETDEEDVICNLDLRYTYSDVELVAHVEALLVKNNKVTMVDFTNLDTSEYLKSVGFRSKLWLLAREKVNVNKVLLVRTGQGDACQVSTIPVKKEWILEGENLSLFYLFGIKNNLFPPSPTEACNTCKFKPICTW